MSDLTRLRMMSHTQGPWTIEFGEAVRIRAPDGSQICTLNWLTRTGRRDGNEGEANARLIAAAPDLLAALQKATHELNAIRARDGAPQCITWDRGRPLQNSQCSEDYFDSLVEECFAATAKAKGI